MPPHTRQIESLSDSSDRSGNNNSSSLMSNNSDSLSALLNSSSNNNNSSSFNSSIDYKANNATTTASTTAAESRNIRDIESDILSQQQQPTVQTNKPQQSRLSVKKLQSKNSKPDSDGWGGQRRQTADQSTDGSLATQDTKKYSNTKVATMNKYKKLYETMLAEAERDGIKADDSEEGGIVKRSISTEHNTSIAAKSAFHNSMDLTAAASGSGATMNTTHNTTSTSSKHKDFDCDDNVSTEDFKVEVPTTPMDTLLADSMIDGLQVEELVLTEEEEQKQTDEDNNDKYAMKNSDGGMAVAIDTMAPLELELFDAKKLIQKDEPATKKKSTNNIEKKKTRKKSSDRHKSKSSGDVGDNKGRSSSRGRGLQRQSSQSSIGEASHKSSRSSHSTRSTKSNRSSRSRSRSSRGTSSRSRSRSQSSRSIINHLEEENTKRKELLEDTKKQTQKKGVFNKLKKMASTLKETINDLSGGVHKYKLGEMARYKVIKVPRKCKKLFDEDTRTVEVEIIAVHVDAVMEHPYYTIKLPDGQSKQTSWDNLMTLSQYKKIKAAGDHTTASLQPEEKERSRSRSLLRSISSRSLSRGRSFSTDARKEQQDIDDHSKSNRSRGRSKPRQRSVSRSKDCDDRSLCSNKSYKSSRSKSNNSRRKSKPRSPSPGKKDNQVDEDDARTQITRKQHNLSSSRI